MKNYAGDSVLRSQQSITLYAAFSAVISELIMAREVKELCEKLEEHLGRAGVYATMFLPVEGEQVGRVRVVNVGFAGLPIQSEVEPILSVRPEGVLARILLGGDAVFLPRPLLVHHVLGLENLSLQTVADWMPAMSNVPGYPGIVAPIRGREDVVGALAILGPELTPDDLPQVALFADQVGVLQENVQLYHRIRDSKSQMHLYEDDLRESIRRELEQRKQRNTLLAAANSLAQTLNTREVASLALKAIVAYLEVECCGLCSISRDRIYLEVLATYYTDESHRIFSPGDKVPLSLLPTMASAIRKKNLMVVGDVQALMAEKAVHTEAMPLPPDLKSQMLIPIKDENRVTGILYINVFGENRLFSGEEITICQGIADQAAVALRNAQLYEAEQQRARRLFAQSAVASTVGRSLDVNEVIHSSLAETLNAFSLPAGSIYLYHDGVLELRASQAVLPVQAEIFGMEVPLLSREETSYGGLSWMRVWMKDAEGFNSNVITAGKSVIVHRIEDGEAGLIPPVAQESGIVAWASSPLIAQGRLLGAMNLFSDDPARFVYGDISILDTIANQISVALDKAYLHQGLESYAINLKAEVDARIGEIRRQKDELETALRNILSRYRDREDDEIVRMLLELRDEADTLDRMILALIGVSYIDDWK